MNDKATAGLNWFNVLSFEPATFAVFVSDVRTGGYDS